MALIVTANLFPAVYLQTAGAIVMFTADKTIVASIVKQSALIKLELGGNTTL